jgi:tryptophan synthase alpha chain
MKNRITGLFEKKKKNILSVFITAGFPRLDSAVQITKLLEESGADMVEFGIPFSDPVADGPVIQESNKIALDNGMTLKILLGQVREIRKAVNLPIVLMGYVNPVLQFGIEAFCKEASEAGVDGLILPDLPVDEYESDFKTVAESNGLLTVFLISPTTSLQRIRKVDAASRGFVYAVSASSTTGMKADFSVDQLNYFQRLAELKLKNPILIGFGISNNKTFMNACEFVEGAIVGSAFITMVKSSSDLRKDIREFVLAVRG